MRRVLKGAGVALGGVLALATVFVAVVLVLSTRRHQAPLPAVVASRDPAIIARGRYLVHGPAHCVNCHGDKAALAAVRAAGGDTLAVPLSGGGSFDLPIGSVRPANLTGDRQTGLGAASDGELARALRHGVSRDGRAMFPFMPFADLADDDLGAVISYLRTLPPVKRPVRQHEINFLGRLVEGLLIRPTNPSGPVLAEAPSGPTAARGRYLVDAVANCAGCHTDRSTVTGAFTGARLAGGLHFESDSRPGITFVTPNLTPDPDTGRVARWTEELFVARFRQGRGAEGTPMPWEAYAMMSDDDLRAIWRHLQEVPPVRNDTGPSVPGAPAGAAQAAR